MLLVACCWLLFYFFSRLKQRWNLILVENVLCIESLCNQTKLLSNEQSIKFNQMFIEIITVITTFIRLIRHFKNEEQNSGFLYVWAVWYRYHIEFSIIFSTISAQCVFNMQISILYCFFFPSFTLTLYQFSHSFSSFFHSFFFFCLFICLKSTPLLIFVAILFRY